MNEKFLRDLDQARDRGQAGRRAAEVGEHDLPSMYWLAEALDRAIEGMPVRSCCTSSRDLAFGVSGPRLVADPAEIRKGERGIEALDSRGDWVDPLSVVDRGVWIDDAVCPVVPEPSDCPRCMLIRGFLLGASAQMRSDTEFRSVRQDRGVVLDSTKLVKWLASWIATHHPNLKDLRKIKPFLQGMSIEGSPWGTLRNFRWDDGKVRCSYSLSGADAELEGSVEAFKKQRQELNKTGKP